MPANISIGAMRRKYHRRADGRPSIGGTTPAAHSSGSAPRPIIVAPTTNGSQPSMPVTPMISGPTAKPADRTKA